MSADLGWRQRCRGDSADGRVRRRLASDAAAEKLKPALKELQNQLRQAGKSEAIEVIVRRGLKFDDLHGAKAKVEAELEAGASYYILDLGRYADEKEFAAKAETFIEKIAV